MDGPKPKLGRNPEVEASFLSRITFSYMLPTFWRGFRRKLGDEDLCEPLEKHRSQIATDRLTRAWEDEKRLAKNADRKPSLFTAMRRIYFKPVALLGLLLFLQEAVKLIQPVAMGRLIRYFRYDSPLTLQEAYWAAGCVAFTGALSAFIHHPYFFGLQKRGLELKVAACGMIMQKGLRLSSGALHKTTVGHIVTLMSNDVAKFDMCFLFVHFLWVSPLILISYTIMLWHEIGVASLAGFGALVVLVPIQGYFSRMMGKCRRQIAVRTDKRVSVMNEILNGIRVIKMYAWEGAFAKVVDELRMNELSKVKEHSIWQSMVMGTFWASGKLIILFAITCYLWLGNTLTAESIFVAMALYNTCRLPLTLFVPFALQFMFEARVSLRRIQTFLELEEYEHFTGKSQISNGNGSSKSATGDSSEKIPLQPNGYHSLDESIVKSDEGEPFVELNKFSAVWETNESTSEDTSSCSTAVKDVSFSAKPGQLIAIVGPVGCGKSSLLSSILRETRRTFGTMSINGTVAYVSQEAWIFCGTIRDNILFGDTYDEKRYMKAIQACSLMEDLDQLPNGDLSVVGDRGQSLSGGQKARVSLARAIYRDADIYLLDDPLSAVDSAVGRHLFDQCIMGPLKSKITILVTHQLQYLQNADRILLMRGGEVLASGTMEELKDEATFADIIQETEESYKRHPSESDPTTTHSPTKTLQEAFGDDDDTATSPVAEDEKLLGRSNSQTESRRRRTNSERLSGSIIDLAKATKIDKKADVMNGEEERSEGAVTWSIYFRYIRAMGQPLIMLPLIVMFAIAVQMLSNFMDWWLNKWTNASEQAIRNGAVSNDGVSNGTSSNNYTDKLNFGIFSLNLDLHDYQTVFTVMVMIMMVISVVRCIWFKMAQVAAARLLHDQMFSAVVRAKILFFDKNPIGRVLNRFSKDVGTMDDQLSFAFFDFFTGTLNFIGMVFVTVMINPVVFVPTLPLALIFLMIRIFYLASSRDIKRIEATTRSPLYSHISAIMQGLTTVRAFSNEDRALKIYHDRQDVNTSAFYLSLATSRWFAATIDWLVALFITGVAFASVLSPALSSSAVGLSLMYAIAMAGSFGRFLELWTRTEINMVSVERITAYAKLPSEPLNKGQIPPNDWPKSGHLYFNNVSLRYDTDSELVLKNIEADIQPKEKIGIVGRTGAGKSSLLRALFRLTEPEGSIMIDGLDTKQVTLQDLRRRLSIIPQDPVLFIGSLRKNLDPFNEFSDEDLWSALEQVELREKVSELSSGLETHMQEGGANFSVGQRQLICLARALLRNAKIIVIDEATANVDPETDALIQRTIKASFINSTVLTIAHRLNTIMDSDRVMVLEHGKLMDLEHAHILLQDENGIFSGLVAETGFKNAQLLRSLAKNAFDTQNDSENE